MPTLTEQLQANIRAVTGTVGQYFEDWHALCDLAGIARGQINERVLAYYNSFNTPAIGTFSAAMNTFLLNPSTVTNGTIPTLFAAGEQGAWYDPSDFSTLFQDSAGTTPVTATTQPVGKILDKSGRGNHATQATATSRPTLQQDASGFYYLNFDGVDDGLATGSIDFTATDKMTLWTGATKISDAAVAVIAELSAAVGSFNGSFQVLAPATAAAANIRFTAKGTLSASGTQTQAANESLVFTGIADIAAPRIASRKNGAYNGSDSATTMGTGAFGNYAMFIGQRSGGTFPFSGRIYSLIIRGAASSATQISNAERYVGAKMGIAL